MSNAAAAEYRRVIVESELLLVDLAGAARRSLVRIRGEHRRIRASDSFPIPEREQAIQTVEAVAAVMEEARR